MASQQPETPWVIFRLRDNYFAIPAGEVQEMVPLPQVTVVPRAPEFVRGMINLRGRVMPLIDLRRRLGMASAHSEMEDLVAMLDQREADHRNWLAELENSVTQGRKFTLATDPHQCAFGKWYDAYDSENFELMGVLQQFDRPHQRIHAIAREVEMMKEAGDFDRAIKLIADTRETALTRMIELFEEVRLAVRRTQREIAMVVERAGRDVALAVDAVESVEELAPGTVEPVQGRLTGMDQNLISRIGRRSEDDEMVLILDQERLVGEAAAAVAGA